MGLMILSPIVANADAGNPILGTIKATSVDNGDGTVTIFVRGQQNWISHNSDCNFDRAGMGVGIIWDDKHGASNGDEVQRVALSGSGNNALAHFTLTFKNPSGVQSTSAAINSTDTAAQLQGKLVAMPSIGAGNVSVTGGPGLTTPWNIEFTGALGSRNVNNLSAGNKTANLTVTITVTSPGGPAEPFNGWQVSKNAVTAFVGTKNATTAGTHANPVDRMAHPTDRGNQVEGYVTAGATTEPPGGYPAGQQFVDPTLNAAGLTDDFTAWKGGCGREPLTGTASNYSANGGPFGEATGRACAGASSSPPPAGNTLCSGHPWGSWGYEKTDGTHFGYSHTYLKTLPASEGGGSGLPDKVCVNFYDVHGGGNAGTTSFQKPNGASEIQVDGNGDNSIETNAFNVFDTSQGGNCINLFSPTITTSATSSVTIGGTISDSATLSGTATGAGGNIVFKAFPPSDPSCTGTAEFTSSQVSVNGDGTYPTSGNAATFTPTHVGDYHWIATYSGDSSKLTLGATTACGDTGETSTVNPASPELTTTSTVTASLNSQSSVNIHDVAHVLQPANTINTTGAITFDVYGPFTGTTTSASCTVAKRVAQGLNATPATNGTGDYTSANYSATAPGTYLWIAHLAADSNNNADDTVCNEANESSLVINPVIDVSKTPASQSVPLNGTAHFTILVTNIGDARLSGIVVGDALAPGCARTAAQTAALSTTQNGHAYLDPNESFTYTCDSDPVTAPFTNVVTACGNDPLGNNVCDTDTNGGNPPNNCPASEANRCASVSVSNLTSKQDFRPKDTGTLSGLVNVPDGTLTFSLFNGTCTAANQLDLNGSGTAGKDLTSSVSANGDYSVTAADFLSTMLGSTNTDGTYNWKITYTGDTQGNADIIGTCGTENFTVDNS
jgi:uncharacterized repeat protein (TIGR01451 family)